MLAISPHTHTHKYRVAWSPPFFSSFIASRVSQFPACKSEAFKQVGKNKVFKIKFQVQAQLEMCSSLEVF